MSLTIRLKLTCTKHPKYTGRTDPHDGCDTCEAIHTAVNRPEEFIDYMFTRAHVRVDMTVLRAGKARNQGE